MKFSPQELILIRQQASTLVERLDTARLVCDKAQEQENEALVNSPLILEQWCEVVAKGNWKQFEKRLAWDNLDLNVVRLALGTVKLTNDQQLPAWAETLNECMEATASVSLETLEKEILGKNRFLNPQEPLAFEEILLPFIYVATKKLRTQAGSYYDLLSEEAHTSLERSLLGWLSYLCLPSMELEFSIFRASRQSTVACLSRKSTGDYSRQQYQGFIQELLTGGMLAFFREYPVLARLMATVTDLWVDATGELLSRLASDWSEIQRTFQPETELGQVVAVQPNLSDRHHNGRSVMAVTFASGLKLIYKPKDLGLEQAYFKLLAWLNEHGIPLPFKLIKVIDRTNYGWVEYVEALPCKDTEEAKRYYQQAGMLLCLVHVLGATDLHSENIIASGEQPVLIDLETLMHPWAQEVQNSKTAKGAKSLAEQQLRNSVIRTTLLPRWQFGLVRGQAYDISGLGKVSQETVFRGVKWLNINTDAMMRRQENIIVPPEINAPSLNGSTLSLIDYHEEIVNGFQQMYWFLMEHRKALLASDSPLIALGNQSVRFIFRATRVYNSILKVALNPQFLRNGAERSIQLDILNREILWFDTKPLFWPLLRIEQQALEQMDIPLFAARSNSDGLMLTPNQTINKYFTEPSFNLVVSRLSQLAERDLEQQLFFIRGSLYTHVAGEAHRFPSFENVDSNLAAIVPLTQSKMIQQAIAIAEVLQKQAISSDDSSATWISPQYVHEGKRFQLNPMGHKLYDGVCGVALFLAALEKVTSGDRFRNLALAALQTLRQDLQGSASDRIVKGMGIGGASGCGSIIYGLVRVSQFLEEPALLEDAKQITSLITPDLIRADQNFDIISGTAGLILGLLTLHNISADSEVLEQAITCGHHLLNHRLASDSGYSSWATLDGTLLTGFSHGAAGIAYALLRLYQATGDVAFLEAAQEAINYERSVFIPEVANWPDFRESSTKERPICMCSWCHGAPGIGLARVGGLDILDTQEIRQDIEAAINTTMRRKLSSMDHLCCGNLGLVEFLFAAARKLSQPQLLETAMEQAAQVVARAEQRGTFSYNPSLGYTPGFFQGATGIGYELLRLAYPDQLPSVLLWE